LRRVAIDIKKQVRGRTVRTATESLAGQSLPDGIAPGVSKSSAHRRDRAEE